jgi:hypothetical protein
MKKIFTYFLCLFAVTTLFSCQKQVDWNDLTTTPVTAATSSKVKTYKEEINVTGGTNVFSTYNLEYDASNRLTSMVSASNPGDKFVFKYNTGSYTMDLFSSNVLSVHQDAFLNSFSLIDSSFQYNDTRDTLTEKYLYNSAKQLVKLKEYDYTKATGGVLYNTHDYTYDNNGNMLTDKDGVSETIYEYYPDLLNTLVFGPNYFYRTKHLVKTTKYTSGGSTETMNHTYTFDSSKRLESETITAPGYTVKKSYTYY